MEYTLRTGDGADKGEHNRLPVMLVLDNLRSAYNVGNLFRVAEATCASGICACGYTAFPPHIKLEKTARGCDALVPCWHYETAAAAILELRKNGYSIYGVETVENAPIISLPPLYLAMRLWEYRRTHWRFAMLMCHCLHSASRIQ